MRRRWPWAWALGLVLGCGGPDDDRFEAVAGPGSGSWGSADVRCQTSSDCSAGEVCEEGLCRMARCRDDFESRPPMGPFRFLGVYAEPVFVNDGSRLDAVRASGDGLLGSWGLGATVRDVAAGNFTGERPHALAVAVAGSNEVRVRMPDGAVARVNVGRKAIAVAAGDTNGDGYDELVAMGSLGGISLCNLRAHQCTTSSMEPAPEAKDAAAADVDGDGYDEPLFLVERDGGTQVVVWNTNHGETGEKWRQVHSLDFGSERFGAGDLDGDGVAELVLLDDGGWWDWEDDRIVVYSPKKGVIETRAVNGHTIDVGVGDRDGDGRAEIALLQEGQKFELLRMNDAKEIVSLGTHSIGKGSSATRVAMADWNGDSPGGRLIEGPELVAGETVPVGAFLFPPYPRGAGALGANILLGDTESTETALTDTLSLSVGVGVGFGADIGIFKSKISGFLRKDKLLTTTHARRRMVGSRYTATAEPELHGSDYAPVVLSCGCYHRYRYVTEDPAKKIGGSGNEVDIYMPVGGDTQLWSSKRYNALAEATGALPIIDVPYRVGDLGSYPDGVQALDGEPVAADDMLFPETPSLQASDVGFVSFWLVTAETETNETVEVTTLGVQTSFGLGGFGVDREVSVGVAQGYALTVGSESIFAGGVPPIPDDPSTPEDEYETHRYSFQPFVYRQRYTDSHGEEGAYYVMSYAVAD